MPITGRPCPAVVPPAPTATMPTGAAATTAFAGTASTAGTSTLPGTASTAGTAAIVLVLLLLLLLPGAAAAAPFFYTEVVRDGTIYVFADGGNARRFEETGKADPAWITRAGYGPGGETVVFDGADAVNLYNFRHDRPGEPPASPPAGSGAPAPEKFPAAKFSGLVFGDYYDVARHHEGEAGPGEPAAALGQQGFWLRRIYLTADVALSARLTTRLRLEANSNGSFEGGDLEPYVKDAYLKWTYAGRHQATLGIQPTLTFDWVEGFWGLRHVEKTPADLYRIDSSRDFGLTFHGPLGIDGLSYGAQYGNESGQGSETDDYKIVRVEARYDRKTGFAGNVVYATADRPDGADRETWSAFAGYRSAAWRAGGSVIRQTRAAAAGAADRRDQEIEIWSVFGAWEFLPGKASLYARYDDVSGNKDGATTGLPGADGIDYWRLSPEQPFGMILVGGEWYLLPGVRVGPNVELATYDADPDPVNAPGRDEDRIYRLTFFWSW